MIPEEELELHIEHTTHLMELEMDRGNREAAVEWKTAMYEAIAARNPALVQRMEQLAMQRIYEPCYFVTKAEEDLAALLRRQAA